MTTPKNRRAVQDLRIEQGTSFNTQSKTFNVMRYPAEVGSTSEDFPHYTMFFITKRQGDVSPADTVRQYRVDISNTNRPDRNTQAGKIAFETALTFGGLQAGSSFVKKVARTFGGRAGPIPTTAGTLAGGGTALAVSQSDRIETLTENRERVYLKDVVALYLSDNPSTSYKAYWKDADIGALASDDLLRAASSLRTAFTNLGGGEFAQAGASAMESVKAALKGASPAAASYFLKNANKGILGGLGDIQALTESSLGVAVNPFTVQLFKNMGFRTFTFSYVFLPKDEAEYSEVQKIVQTFKKYMHPTRNQSTGGVFLGYPAEFEIQYFYRNNENNHLFKIGNCALTDLKVEYGGQDFTTFRAIPGAPSEMKLQLSFTELEVLTADRIEEGY